MFIKLIRKIFERKYNIKRKFKNANKTQKNTSVDLSVYNTQYYPVTDNPLKFSSARHIISVINKYYKPRSVIDMGCGNGIFLKCWEESGVSEILGLDGNNINDDELYISRDKFKSVNFENYINQSDKKYDLAMSCEVAEHIPEKKALMFVKNLCSFSDFILFSAAIPYQDGLNHINCQPLKYWVDLFYKQGYACFDFIRPQLFNKHEDIFSWYMQNILFFCKNDKKSVLLQNAEGGGLNETNNPLMFYHASRVKIIIEQLRQDINYFQKDQVTF